METDGRQHENVCKDDTDHHRPANECALREHAPEDGRMDDEHDGAEYELPERVSGLAAVEKRKGLQEGCARRWDVSIEILDGRGPGFFTECRDGVGEIHSCWSDTAIEGEYVCL